MSARPDELDISDELVLARLRRQLAREQQRRIEAERISEQVTAQLYHRQLNQQLSLLVSRAAARSGTFLRAASEAVLAILAATPWQAGYVWRHMHDGRWERHGPISPDTPELAMAIESQLPHYLATSLPEHPFNGSLPGAIPRELERGCVHVAVAAVGAGSSGSDGYIEFWSQVRGDDSPEALDVLRHLGAQLAHLLRRELDRQLYDAPLGRDPLTGLLNRTGLNLALEEFAPGADAHTALALLDVADFSAINDFAGGEGGDRLLCEISRRLQQALPDDAPIARLGGNTFALLIDAQDEDAAVLARQRELRTRLGSRYRIEGTALDGVQFSVGIARWPPRTDAGAALARAEIALRVAKRSPGRMVLFDEAMASEASEKTRMRFALADALARGEFEPWYQPIVATADGAIVGVETLLRWRSPQFGLVSPATFIPMLEESGAIHEVGAWVLERALADAAGWRDADGRHLRLSVNVSVLQLHDRELPARIATLLRRHGYPAAALELELTETVFLNSNERLRGVLDGLCSIGVRLSLDDFGTGYSALGYLQRMPLHTLKIDRTFVTRVDTGRGQNLLKAFVQIAAALKMEVVAEGVESSGDHDALRMAGCQRAQGFAFSEPVPADAFASLLARARLETAAPSS